MPYLDRSDVRIYYETHGEPTSAPTLLLSHGYSAAADMWKPNLAALAAGRQVIVWDMRGHGRSDSPPDPGSYSEELSVDDMAALLDAAGGAGGAAGPGPGAKAVIGGLSLGGYLSLAFHLRYPDRVAGLLICDAGPGYRKDEPRDEWNAMANRWADNFERDGLDSLSRSAEVQASEHRSAQGLALAARHILTQRDSRVVDSLTGIGVPTLVVVGSEDKAFLAAADMMAAKIPGATKAVIAGAGHAANLDQPAAFDKAVVEFLDSI